MFFSTSENEYPELYKNGGRSAMLQISPPPGKICNEREKICNVANLPLGEGLQCCRSSGGRSAMVQIFRGKACNVADLSGGLQGGRSVIQQRQNVIILTSYTLEEISQHPYSHYMGHFSYDYTNNFWKLPMLVALLTHLLAIGGDGQTHYTWYRWLLSNHCCQGTKKIET